MSFCNLSDEEVSRSEVRKYGNKGVSLYNPRLQNFRIKNLNSP